jgi:hypothetical protein
MQPFLWGLTIASSLFGTLFVVSALFLSKGAPQEAAGAALGVAFAVIPYCIARAHAMLGRTECPRCDERIGKRAMVCPHCGAERSSAGPSRGAF